MASMGFEGDPPVCDDCLTYCEADVSAGGSDEATVLACFEEASQNVVCGGGIQGALPYIDTINLCCEDRQESPYCTRLCEALLANDIASQFVPTCEAWAD